MARPLASAAVDLVIFTIRDRALHVLTVVRGWPPFEGRLALPGGFVEDDEDFDEAALRELGEETSLTDPRLHIEQLRTYGTPDRDPRGRIFSVAYVALLPDAPDPIAGDDARAADWHPVQPLLDQPDMLAFDHHRILSDALERVRSKLEYTNIATAFVPKTFTIGELREVYTIIWGVTLDARNFYRKVTTTQGLLVPTGARRTKPHRAGRPSAVYRAGEQSLLTPPLLRP